MANKVFIIGNGFDVDLGFRTKYSDYYELGRINHHWPIPEHPIGLGEYLTQRTKAENWLDLEMALYQYASMDNVAVKRLENGRYPIELDKQYFNTLKSFLSTYLNLIVCNTYPNNKSVAKKVLRYILDKNEYSIYSFNYTNLRKFSAIIFKNASFADDFEDDINYTHIHGSIKNNDIILGVHSDAPLIEGYDFLRKINQPSFNSGNLLADLGKAEEVVIFGLSLGLIDFQYFRDFFRKLCSDITDSPIKKRITIFTYNASSEQQINRNLRELTGTDLLLLKTNTLFEVFHTIDNGESDKKGIQEWLSRE